MVAGRAADAVDDRKWFEANPARAHRLRRPFEGELSSLMRQPEQPPPHHETQVLVRQIEPGLRARAAFHRDLRVPVPDDESIVHAICDLIATRRPVSVREVVELAEQYATAAKGSEQ